MMIRKAFLCSILMAGFLAIGDHAGLLAGVGKPAPDFTLTAQSGVVLVVGGSGSSSTQTLSMMRPFV